MRAPAPGPARADPRAPHPDEAREPDAVPVLALRCQDAQASSITFRTGRAAGSRCHENRSKQFVFAGLLVLLLCLTGVAAMACAVDAWIKSDHSAVGINLLAAAVAFGFLVTAMLRE